GKAPSPAPSKKAPAKKPAARSYAAEREAAKYGLTVQWDSSLPGHYTGTSYYLGGYYMTPSNTVIRLNPVAQQATHPRFEAVTRGAVRHEAAHAAIFRHCGTLNPKVAGRRQEPVTDAYAALFYGAGPSSGGYGYTSADAAAAKKIRAGQCS